MANELTSTTTEKSAFEPLFDLREILGFAWRHWRFTATIACIILLVGITILIRLTPLYTATAQILLERQRERPPGGDVILTAVDPDVAMVEGEMAILKSTVFLRRVVEREHLVADRPPSAAAGMGAEGHSIFEWFHALIPGSAASTPARASSPEADEIKATKALGGSLDVRRGTQFGFVLNVSVTSADPAKAAQLANAVANAYLVDKLDTRFDAVKRASTWLNDRLVELHKQLHDSEEAVAQFRQTHDLYQTGNITLNQQELSQLNAKLVEARADLAQQKARLDVVNSLRAKGSDVTNMPELGSGTTLPTLRQQQSTLSQQEAQLLARYGPAHPLVVNVRAQEQDVARSIAAETQRLAAAVKDDYAMAQSRVASLEKSLQQATGQNSVDDKTTIRLRELERTSAVNKTLFEDFLQRAKITQEQSTFEPREARIITPALPPISPSYPRKTMFLFVNLVIGLFLGVVGAVVKEKLNSGFTLPKQIEDILGLPMLTSISRLTERERTIEGKVVPIYDYPAVKPLSRFSESIRALRSGIQMTDVDHPPKVIQFTSAAPGEGKTTTTLAVARSAALSKLKVLFIDADLRRPSASRFFGLSKQPGLVELLLGEVDEEAVIRFREEVGYSVLSAGNETQTPTDLLSSERMKALIAGLKKKFDLIVLDTPPIGPVVDPVVVSQLADKIVLVVRWGATARELIKECLQQLARDKKIAGVALNVVNDRQAQKYGKYAYSYYYRRRYYRRYYAD